MTVDAGVATTREERKSRERRRTRVAAAAAVLTLFLMGSCAMAAAASMAPRIPVGTYVIGIDVGGLTRTEAEDTIARALAWESRRLTVAWASEGREVCESPLLEELGLHPDVDGTLKQVPTTVWWARTRPRLDVPLIVAVDEAGLAEAIASFGKAVEKPALDARLVVDDQDGVRIIGETVGRALDEDEFRRALVGSGKWDAFPGRVELPVVPVMPDLTESRLKALGIRKMIASYSTTLNKDKDRTDNIKIAALRLDGYMLAPGQVFSFNDVIGPRTADSGYKETPVYWRDEVKKGLGGGVCQLSTTLYNVALLANLEIVERHPHSLTVDYVPLGRDAAVSYGEVDLKFRNNTLSHLLIKAEVADNKVHVKLFGNLEVDQKVTISAQVLKKLDFTTETIVDPTLPSGQVQVRDGKPGYVVRAERLVYVNGTPAKKEVLGVSSYYPLKKQIKIGPGTPVTTAADQPARSAAQAEISRCGATRPAEIRPPVGTPGGVAPTT
ncbi:MAG: VanW family protein [Firmicutes bacterium]|jgi:vancomycin resistance protein YoaR|nr:VanW family protein [Bacillota bacterium]